MEAAVKPDQTELEATLNQLDIKLAKVEAEPLIERCLELGFLPWDNAKFQVFLHWYVQANLSCRGDHRFMRGIITARFLNAMMPITVDADIAQDIRLWPTLKAMSVSVISPLNGSPAAYSKALASDLNGKWITMLNDCFASDQKTCGDSSHPERQRLRCSLLWASTGTLTQDQ